jgi:hypothetical protein
MLLRLAHYNRIQMRVHFRASVSMWRQNTGCNVGHAVPTQFMPLCFRQGLSRLGLLLDRMDICRLAHQVLVFNRDKSLT